MQRRELLSASLAAPLALGVAASAAPRNGRAAGRFKLDYAPHFGMFRAHAGGDLMDQLRFMHDEGFRSLEDNGMPGKDPKTQEAIGQFLRDHEMRMGVFVAHGDFGSPTFAIPPAEARELVLPGDGDGSLRNVTLPAPGPPQTLAPLQLMPPASPATKRPPSNEVAPSIAPPKHRPLDCCQQPW